MSSEKSSNFSELYQWLLERVKPERDHNNRKKLKEIWWQFAETRKGLRIAIECIPRYIATAETAKHRLFQFLDSQIVPDHMLVAFATGDAFHLGVLSSRLHLVWSLKAGGTLKDRPRYNSSRCFQAFPFPIATPSQQDRIRELAEQLDAHRKRQQAQHASLTLTDLYNVVEKLRAGAALSPKEQLTNQQGLASVLLSLHQRLDAAVVQAYGWAADLSEAELLRKLVQLNQVRIAEEAAGVVQYLRPAYQAPKQQEQQAGLGLTAVLVNGTATGTAQAWPAELADQMRAVRTVVQQAEKPLTTGQVAAYFIRTRPEKVRPLLDTLTALALVRPTLEGTYAG